MKKRRSMGIRLALAVSGLAPAFVRAFFFTCRKIHIGSGRAYANLRDGVPMVAAMWHQRVMLLLRQNAYRGHVVMVSRSTDGEIVARLMRRMGYFIARGSSTRGGREAREEMVALVRAGRTAGFVADGPLGPPRVAKMGAVISARDAGVPLFGITAAASRSIFVKSWDQTEIPLPFSTIVIGYTEPFMVPPGLSADEYEALRARLERELEDIDAQCVELARPI